MPRMNSVFPVPGLPIGGFGLRLPTLPIGGQVLRPTGFRHTPPLPAQTAPTLGRPTIHVTGRPAHPHAYHRVHLHHRVHSLFGKHVLAHH